MYTLADSATALPPSGDTAAVMDAFSGQIEPGRAVLRYRLGLLVVALAMVLLPLLYLGVAMGAAWLVIWHTLDHAWILTANTSFAIGRVILYFGPIAAGVIIVFFMFKPFLARQPRRPEPRGLDPAAEPLLFAFIERISASVGAPMPSAVHVDLEVNASASFHHGWRSLAGHDLALTLGLPLAAGLSQRELAGVIAHEMGHFAQGTGMRLTFVIRSINGWFSRVVYERDAWDELLEDAARTSDARIAIVLQLSRGAVWLTRQLLKVFMMAGHAISCFMLRQMEYDADGYAARVVGSATFAEAGRRVQTLHLASRAAHADLNESWQSGRLPDDVPCFIVGRSEALADSIRAAVDEVYANDKTGLFDTHPSDTDRLHAIERAQAPGIFHRAEPASALFSDFGELSRSATKAYYSEDLALSISDQQLIPTSEALHERDTVEVARAALMRYLHGLPVWFRPIVVGEEALRPPADARACAEDLARARNALTDTAESTVDRARQYHEREGEAIRVTVALRLYEAGFQVPPLDFGLPSGTAAAAADRLSALAAIQERCLEDCLPFEDKARLRLSSALRLLRAPATAARLEDAPALLLESAALVPVLATAGAVREPLLKLRREQAALRTLMLGLQGKPVPAPAAAVLEQCQSRVRRWITELQAATAAVPYPFAHARGAITVAEFARTDQHSDNDIVQAYLEASTHVERLTELYPRVLGRLAAIAEQVEAVVLDGAAETDCARDGVTIAEPQTAG